jgi:hypothetical protein
MEHAQGTPMTARTALRAVVIVGLLNFCAFWYGSLIFGGSAANGRREGGHFYLGEHGRHTEVDERVFAYSRIHGSTLWFSHPMAMLAGLALYALGDPFVTHRNKMREGVFFAVAAVGMALTVLLASPVVFWMFPVLILVQVALQLREVSRLEESARSHD